MTVCSYLDPSVAFPPSPGALEAAQEIAKMILNANDDGNEDHAVYLIAVNLDHARSQGHAAALAEVREAERTPTERPAGPVFPEAPEAAVIVSMLADED